MNDLLKMKKIRRGGALVLVTISLGAASVLSLSLLAVSTLQTQASDNSVAIARAHAAADAGVDLAMHYLQHPDDYTGPMPDGYYPGENALEFAAHEGLTITTQVTYNIDDNNYTIQSEAQTKNDRIGTIQRNITAKVKTIPTGGTTITPLVDGLTTNADIALDSSMVVTGSPNGVRSRGRILVRHGGRVTGNVVSDEVITFGDGIYTGTKKSHRQSKIDAEAASPTGNLLSAMVEAVLFQPHTVAPAAPTNSEMLVLDTTSLPDLRLYRYRNPLTGLVATFSAQKLVSTNYSNVTFDASIVNPAGIFWTDQPTTMTKVTVNGTLLMTNGATLTIAAGAPTVVTPAAKYPGIVADGPIELTNGAQLEVNGLVYARKFIAPAGAAGRLRITGALALWDKVAPFPTDNYAGDVQIIYDAAKAQIGGFGMSVADTDIKAVRVLSWTAE